MHFVSRNSAQGNNLNTKSKIQVLSTVILITVFKI